MPTPYYRPDSCSPRQHEGDDRRGAGFTLVELLVSMVVVITIALMVGVLTNEVSRSTVQAGKMIDADNQARQIYLRMASDFAAIAHRKDVNFYFHHMDGNDELYFYSQTSGHDATSGASSTLSGASLIGYRVNSFTNDRVELERLAYGLHLDDVTGHSSTAGTSSSMVFLPLLIKNAYSQALANVHNCTSDPSTTNPSQWDVVGDQVFRLEFCFVLKDGIASAIPVLAGSTAKSNLTANRAPVATDDTTAGYSIGSRWYDADAQVAYQCVAATAGNASWAYTGLQDVNSIVVTLALLPAKSRSITSIASIKNAVSVFPDYSTAPAAVAWQKKADDPSALISAGLNTQAASSVRVYERHFTLN